MISIDSLETMFAGIRSAGQLSLDEPVLWGYFFTDPSHLKLESVVPELRRLGYRPVAVYEPELDPGTEPYYFLHVEREEVHTVSSLFERNAELEAFAAQHGLATYDGMDVGPVAST